MKHFLPALLLRGWGFFVSKSLLLSSLWLTCLYICLIYEICIAERPNLPENYKESTWEKLKEAVHAIHASTSISSSLEELYKAVENLCSHQMSSALYEKLQDVCENHVKSNIGQFLAYPFWNSILFTFTQEKGSCWFMYQIKTKEVKINFINMLFWMLFRSYGKYMDCKINRDRLQRDWFMVDGQISFLSSQSIYTNCPTE